MYSTLVAAGIPARTSVRTLRPLPRCPRLLCAVYVRCQAENCTKRAGWRRPGDTPLLYCNDHKQEGMIPNRSRRVCCVPGAQSPVFGISWVTKDGHRWDGKDPIDSNVVALTRDNHCDSIY